MEIINMERLLWIIPVSPLLTAGVIGLATAFSPRRGVFPPRSLVNVLACLGPIVSFVISCGVFLSLNSQESTILHQRLFSWISTGALNIDFGLEIDRLGGLMLVMVSFVGSLIHIYSTGYMKHDPGHARFFSYLNLFLSSMLILVMGSNLVVLFLGWEGVGLCSYLLIGFWFEDEAKASAGKKAFITNRIGDFGFILGIFLIFKTLSAHGFASLEFSYLAEHAAQLAPVATAAGLLLFLGAAGKSAQIPLYVWLPDAMAGPTPVSALIHAATMVTAGVFMVAKMHFLYQASAVLGYTIATVGMATALVAAIVGMGQWDIKKVLAYSTISQLGYMFVGVGTGAYSAGMFHVFTHAFFKACLFLGAGSVIHALHEEQDIRNMGGLIKRLPVTSWTFLVAWLAICGLPPFSGFFSKDQILSEVFNTWGAYGKLLWVLGLAGAGLTAFYMSRLTFLVFFGKERFVHLKNEDVHESPTVMTAILVVLAIGAALVGFLGVPEALGGTNLFAQWLAPSFSGEAGNTHDLSRVLEYLLMAASVAVALGGIAVAYRMFLHKPFTSSKPTPVTTALLEALYIDKIYDRILLSPITVFSRNVLHAIIDVKVIDGFINGLAWIAALGGRNVRLLQTGSVRTGLYYIVAGVAVSMLIIFLRSQ
jgi:NADH-quinone oxidoreductase subunit L